MKKTVFSCLAVVALLLISFVTGSYVREQKQNNERTQRCRTLISFAIDKAENENINDQSVRVALASNIYAAYQYCDDAATAEQIHELWNYLLSDGENSAAKEIILQELKAVVNSYNPPKK